MTGQLAIPIPPEVWQPVGAVLAAGVGAATTLLGRRWFGRGPSETDATYLWNELRKSRQDSSYWYEYAQQLQRVNDALAHHARSQVARAADETVE